MKNVYTTLKSNNLSPYIQHNGVILASNPPDHGGPYWVKFRPDGAECEVMGTFTAPKSPEEYTWIFPTGCYSYCKSDQIFPYLIGPIPPFQAYEYAVDGTPIVGGSGIVEDLSVLNVFDGGLTLTLNNGFCAATTDRLQVTEEGCRECEDVQMEISRLRINEDDGFVFYDVFEGGIFNPYNFTITVSFTSPEGVFVPSAVSVPPGGTYLFDTDPIVFIPFDEITAGINVEALVTGNLGGGNTIICRNDIFIDMSQILKSAAEGKVKQVTAHMMVVPNPVSIAASVHYAVEDVEEFAGGTMEMYSLTGHLIKKQPVYEGKGRLNFDLSGLASGTYVVVFFSEGQRVGQQVVVKQ